MSQHPDVAIIGGGIIGLTSAYFLTKAGLSVSLFDRADFGTEVTAGGSYLFGFSHENGFFSELRVGGGNVPSLKIGAGWSVKIQ